MCAFFLNLLDGNNMYKKVQKYKVRLLCALHAVRQGLQREKERKGRVETCVQVVCAWLSV